MRLFIGIALDDALRVQLRREAEALRAHMRGNFSLPANYHVTARRGRVDRGAYRGNLAFFVLA